jgi:hypothetical protein
MHTVPACADMCPLLAHRDGRGMSALAPLLGAKRTLLIYE